MDHLDHPTGPASHRIPSRPGPRVLKLELRFDGTRLKGFADVELDGGIIIRSFRVVEERGNWPQVLAPTISVKPPGRPVYYKTVITLPADLKRAVDFVILTAFRETLAGRKEQMNERLDSVISQNS